MMVKKASKAKHEKLYEEKENAELQDCSFRPKLCYNKEEDNSSIL